MDLAERFVLGETAEACGVVDADNHRASNKEPTQYVYDLVSVVVHIGSAHTDGHYVCITRCSPPSDVDGEAGWTLFDDGKKPVRLRNFEAVQQRCVSPSCACY